MKRRETSGTGYPAYQCKATPGRTTVASPYRLFSSGRVSAPSSCVAVSCKRNGEPNTSLCVRGGRKNTPPAA